MKKYLLVNEYEDIDDSLVHKQYIVTEAETPTEAILSDLKDGLFGTAENEYDELVDFGYLKKSTVDIREIQGSKTIGDNLIYDILENSWHLMTIMVIYNM